MSDNSFDLFVIGGGINGTGIARDAQGRGLSVALAEMGDLAGQTSSASTKLFHGGLRYLEFFEFNLVRKALIEREVLLKAMPHISWPMRFVLPYHPDMRFEGGTPTSKLLTTVMPWMKGRRPSWIIRLGLFLYDNLGGRELLPGTSTVKLTNTPEGEPLDPKFEKAFEYSDCWVEDSRLVALNARDAAERGATIMTRTKVTRTERSEDAWTVHTEDTETGETGHFTARYLVNAGGPWVQKLIQGQLEIASNEGVRLVRGSHIVTRKLFDHEKAYFFQGEDGRIIFAIPYEYDFTLIGTTDADHKDGPEEVAITEGETDYLLRFVNKYLRTEVTRDDIVWTYSGVRPLYDDGAKSATAATRDYVLSVDAARGAPVLHVFGGKITTFRKLAENALDRIRPQFSQAGEHWTSGVPLPGGDFRVAEVQDLIEGLRRDFAFLTPHWARRLVRAYGTEARDLLDGARSAEDLGQAFGATLTAREVDWLMDREFARTAEDVVWRRTKLGLRLEETQVRALDDYMQGARQRLAAE